LKEKRLDESLRSCTLAGPPSPTVEETSPSGLGVQQIPRPDSGVPEKITLELLLKYLREIF
jgi:hypothetical protein